MLTFNEIAALLDDIVDVLPPELTKGLTGGIYLVPEPKPHPALPFPKYMVMGEYINQHQMGSHVFVYYGSVIAAHPDADVAEMRVVLKDIVHHELRHHVEGKAGSKALEIEDANFVQAALSAGNK
jgi:hypothetical protein